MISSQLLEAWTELRNVDRVESLELWMAKWAHGENHFVEYKQSLEDESPTEKTGKKRNNSTRHQFSKFAKTLCAFANGQGGIHLIGIRDKGDWESGLILERDDDTDSLRGLIPRLFFRVYPRFDVQHFRNLGFTAILIQGNERVPLLIHGIDGFLGSFRRYGSSSLPISTDELHLSLSNWNEQYRIINDRYNSLKASYQLHNPTFGSTTNSSFFVNSLPSTVLSTKSFQPFSHRMMPGLFDRLPGYFEEVKPIDARAFYSVVAENSKESSSIRISAYSPDSCLVDVQSGSPSDFYALTNRQLCMVALYATTALLNSVDGCHKFAVQGVYSHDSDTRMFASEPILLQYDLPPSYDPSFPNLNASDNLMELSGRIYESIAQLLRFDLSDYRGRSQNATAFARAVSRTAPWNLC